MKKATPDALNNRRRFLNLVCLLVLLIPKRTSQFLVQLDPVVVGFLKIPAFILLLSRENITRSIFRALEARGANTYLPALPAILLQKIKTNCVRMTIGNAENSE